MPPFYNFSWKTIYSGTVFTRQRKQISSESNVSNKNSFFIVCIHSIVVSVYYNKMAESNYLSYPKDFATTAIHAGQEFEQEATTAVVPPLVTSSTFKQRVPPNKNVRFI